MSEVWKKINENYEISSFGRVRSVAKTWKCGTGTKHKPCQLIREVNGKVQIKRNNLRQKVPVEELMKEFFPNVD